MEEDGEHRKQDYELVKSSVTPKVRGRGSEESSRRRVGVKTREEKEEEEDRE